MFELVREMANRLGTRINSRGQNRRIGDVTLDDISVTIGPAIAALDEKLVISRWYLMWRGRLLYTAY